MKGLKLSLSLLLLLSLFSCTSLSSKDVKSDLVGNKFAMFLPYIDGRITVEFSEEKVVGFSGVNRFFGGYKISSDSISVGPLASTMMAGPMEDMVKEQFILSSLNSAEKIEVENSVLTITTKENKKLKFKKISSSK